MINTLKLLSLILILNIFDARGQTFNETFNPSIPIWNVTVPITTQETIVRNQTLGMTAVNKFEELSIDGVDIPLDNLTNLYFVEVPKNSRLFTFVASIPTTSACVGMVASVDIDYMLTSKKCKCSSSPGNGYTQLGFDDSHWLDAVEYGAYGSTGSYCGLPVSPEISPEANWIWVSNTSVSREVAFCRCYSDICERNNPCKNNGVCNVNKPNICTCLDRWYGEFCDEENMMPLAVTAKETLLELFVDGSRILPIDYATEWQKAMVLSINAYTRLVAIAAANYINECEGILVSVDGAYAMSGATWKCTSSNDERWFDPDFDDSDWPHAVVIGNNTYGLYKCAGDDPTVDGVDSSAEWIWTDDLPNRNTLVYCRGVLPACSRDPCVNGGKCQNSGPELCKCLPGYTGKYCEIVGSLIVSMTSVYNLGGVYVDGVLQSLPNHDDFYKVDTMYIDPASKVIAVYSEATNTHSPSCHGLISSITIKDNDNYTYVTNTDWKCTHNTNVGWFNVGFNETWNAAAVLGSNGNLPGCSGVPFYDEILPSAEWIWASTSDLVSFCRYNLPLCDYLPCQNGGTCHPNSPKLCDCTSSFTGEYCEIGMHNKTSLSAVQNAVPDCGQNGFPVKRYSKMICKCLPGFIGKKCEKEITRCGQGSCSNGGKCINLHSKSICLCPSGFYGKKCQFNK